MRAYVIDSNMLQTKELDRLLSVGDTVAILPDFVWYELYKQQTLDALRLGLSVLGDHPDKVVLLRPSAEISRLNPAVADELHRLIWDGPLGDVSEMIRIVRAEAPMLRSTAAQLRTLWGWARTLRPSLIEGAAEIAQSFPEMEESMFDSQEVRIIRTNGKYTPRMIFKIYGAAEQIWENLAAKHYIELEGLDKRLISQAYLFRFALGILILLIWWIRGGSQLAVRLDRLSNDMIDLSLAVHATYFDGIVTRDEKARWVHYNLVQAIISFQNTHDLE